MGHVCGSLNLGFYLLCEHGIVNERTQLFRGEHAFYEKAEDDMESYSFLSQLFPKSPQGPGQRGVPAGVKLSEVASADSH